VVLPLWLFLSAAEGVGGGLPGGGRHGAMPRGRAARRRADAPGGMTHRWVAMAETRAGERARHHPCAGRRGGPWRGAAAARRAAGPAVLAPGTGAPDGATPPQARHTDRARTQTLASTA